MVNVFPAVQLNALDPATNPVANLMLQVGGIGLSCQNGITMQDSVALPANSTNVALAFPIGVTTAVVIYVAAITTTDLIVKVGSGSPVSLSLPANQGMLLYGLTSAQVSLNSVLGGHIQYAVGG